MLKIENLSISFQKEIIYNNFSLEIKSGQSLAVTGKSGSGKSTLLNLLAGFIPEFTGNIQITGIELNAINISEIRKQIAWLPQETALKFKTVDELFYAPFTFVQNKSKYPNQEEVRQIFNEFELSIDLLSKNAKDISGGQRQRIILASCLLLKKPLLLIDEPTSALDDAVKHKVTDYILGLKNITIIASTHDSYWISKSDKVLKL